jgi:Swt1-like HEPN
LLPVWINVRLQPGGERLFRKMADSVWTMITEQDGEREDQALRRRYDRVKDPTRDWYELQDDTQQFLKLVRARSWKVVLVLDEFDSAREVFKSLPGTFQALRELADNPDWSIGLVTTSRRELRDIVDIADPAESTFHGIFRELWLTCFDEAEIKDLAARAPMTISADDSAQLTSRLLELTGGHPCLASLVLERLCATTGTAFSQKRLEAAVTETRPEFRSYYQDLTDLLRSDGRFRALLEILLGPQITATIDDAERLLHEGLLIADDDGYRTFSDDFGRYLTMVGRETDYWPTWVSVEHGLRDLVEEVLTTAYPDGWADGVRRARPSLCEQLDKWVKLMEREQRSFGERASSRLLDFSYPKDLYVLMASYWDLFGKLMGHDKKYWNDRFELLSKVRNPMVHNRLLAVTSAERELFHAYCLEILELLAEYAGPGNP